MIFLNFIRTCKKRNEREIVSWSRENVLFPIIFDKKKKRK